MVLDNHTLEELRDMFRKNELDYVAVRERYVKSAADTKELKDLMDKMTKMSQRIAAAIVRREKDE